MAPIPSVCNLEEKKYEKENKNQINQWKHKTPQNVTTKPNEIHGIVLIFVCSTKMLSN